MNDSDEALTLAYETVHRLHDQAEPATPEEIRSILKLLARTLTCEPPPEPVLQIYVETMTGWSGAVVSMLFTETIRYRTDRSFPLLGELVRTKYNKSQMEYLEHLGREDHNPLEF